MTQNDYVYKALQWINSNANGKKLSAKFFHAVVDGQIKYAAKAHENLDRAIFIENFLEALKKDGYFVYGLDDINNDSTQLGINDELNNIGRPDMQIIFPFNVQIIHIEQFINWFGFVLQTARQNGTGTSIKFHAELLKEER